MTKYIRHIILETSIKSLVEDRRTETCIHPNNFPYNASGERHSVCVLYIHIVVYCYTYMLLG